MMAYMPLNLLQLRSLRFRPRPLTSIAALFFVIVTTSLGIWQTGRADEKRQQQAKLDAMASEPAIVVTGQPIPADALVSRKVVARGEFLDERTLLIDNRVYRGAPGYHVVTPLRIEDTDMHVLVNRGWIAGNGDRSRIPTVIAQTGRVAVEGMAVFPPRNSYALAPDTAKGPVRQHLVLSDVQAETGLKFQPVVIQQESREKDGLVRDWPQPDAGVNVHLAYALQWYVMAAVIAILWIALNIQRVNDDSGGTQS